MKSGALAAILLTALIAASPASARSHHRKSKGAAGPFDYYLLSLSYAPDFCDQSSGNKDVRECGSGRQLGFVVHGLWPQSEAGRGPENCGGSPVAQDLVQLMLHYIPSESLIQHEWMTHGTCSGLSAQDYFALVRKARDSVQIPPALAHVSSTIQSSPAEVQAKFAAANPSFPANAFRVSCYRGGELQEARICMTKDLTARDCTPSDGHCDSDQVTILPVR